MKRILVFSHALELGGAEKALLGLLEAIDKNQYCVDLFLMRHEGELLPYIPEGVNLLPEIPAYSCLAVPMARVLKKGQFAVAFGRARGKAAARRRVKELGLPGDNDVSLQYSHKYTLFAMPRLGGTEYDLAISFLTPHYFVANRVKAKRKIAWIHTDYSTVAVDREEQLQMWSAYDRIISISEQVSRSFCKTFPELSDKLILIPHFLPVQSMRIQAEAFSAEAEMPKDGALRLLSIGRFCTAKNFDNVPDICRRIRESGWNVKWYLIGFGGDEALIRSRIEEAGMGESVVILGRKGNPYPYIRACDLYVQPSRYEGKCVSVLEAQILGKPVVIADYPTAQSQLRDGVDGVIVPQDNEGCARGIAKLLEDPEKMAALCKSCELNDYSGAGESGKLYELME